MEKVTMEKISLAAKLALLDEYWSPRVICELNGQKVVLAKLKGEFLWHQHETQDEMFLVIEGQVVVRLRDQDVVLEKGELFVVPRGVEHLPVAEDEAHVLLFEPLDTVNTGDVRCDRTMEAMPKL
jgi:mannose-6-phosphate isomerase-like protein (cupin superfamily)